MRAAGPEPNAGYKTRSVARRGRRQYLAAKLRSPPRWARNTCGVVPAPLRDQHAVQIKRAAVTPAERLIVIEPISGDGEFFGIKHNPAFPAKVGFHHLPQCAERGLSSCEGKGTCARG